MLAKTLSRMIDTGMTSAKEIGELTGVAPSTVYRWVRGESQPDFDAIRLLVRHLKNPQAVEALLSAFIAGTAWRYYNLEGELDVNKDGTIDASDALDASIEAVRSAARSLAQVRDACRDGLLPRETVIELVALLNDVIRHCSVTQQVLVHMSETRPKRKLLKLAK
jgi:transcriptional regulator with XRE-family HTH domain